MNIPVTVSPLLTLARNMEPSAAPKATSSAATRPAMATKTAEKVVVNFILRIGEEGRHVKVLSGFVLVD